MLFTLEFQRARSESAQARISIALPFVLYLYNSIGVIYTSIYKTFLDMDLGKDHTCASIC